MFCDYCLPRTISLFTDSGTLKSERSSEPDYEVPPTRLPWGAIKDRTEFPENIHINPHVKPGEFILQTVFAEFTVLTQKIITEVLNTAVSFFFDVLAFFKLISKLCSFA